LLLAPGLAADGDLDPSFGDNGRLLFIGDIRATDELFDILLLPDGKIVGVGFTTFDTQDVVIARFNEDGSFDTSFGLNGKAVYDFGASERARAVIVLEDGKYLIAGDQRVSGDSNILLVRVDSDGALDTSFGTEGVLIIEEGYANDLLLLPDGRIIVGATVDVNDDDFALVVLDPSGRLDTTFGDGGYVRVSFGGTEDEFRRLALTLDGRILAAGLSDSGDLLVTRITPSGRLDSDFGSGGKVILASSVLGVPLGGGSSIADVSESVGLAVQLDGKIVVGSGGRVGTTSDFDLILARLHPDGTLDSSFGADGVSIEDLTNQNDVLADLAIQADGKIVAVATVFDSEFPFDPWGNVLVQRYNSDGTADRTFGANGWVMTDILEGSGENDAGRSVVIQPDGNILVGGYGPDADADTTDIALVRYLSSIDVAGAFDVLASSFEMLSPSQPALHNLLKQAARHVTVNSDAPLYRRCRPCRNAYGRRSTKGV